MAEKRVRRGVRVQHEDEVMVVDLVTVSEVMVTDALTVPYNMTVSEVIGKINEHDPELTRHQALLIVAEEESLRGIITRHDIIKAISQNRGTVPVLEAGSTDLIVAHPVDGGSEAMTLMLHGDVGALPWAVPN